MATRAKIFASRNPSMLLEGEALVVVVDADGAVTTFVVMLG